MHLFLCLPLVDACRPLLGAEPTTASWLSGQGVSTMMILAGLAFAGWGLREAWLRRTLKRKSSAHAAHPPIDVHDTRRLGEELSELTNRLAQQLDQKAARIERLIADADQRGARLEALVADLGRAANALPDVSRVPAHPSHPPAHAMYEPKPAPGFDPRPAAPGPFSPDFDPLHRDVYTLADQGLAPVDIAKRLERPTGQIELILALRRAAAGR